MQLHAGRLKVIPADELPKMASAHPERSMQGVRQEPRVPLFQPRRLVTSGSFVRSLDRTLVQQSDLVRSHPISSSTPIHPAEAARAPLLPGIPNLGVPDAFQIRDDFQTLVGMLDMGVPDASQIRDDGPSRLPNMGLSAAPMPQSPNMESERRMPHITSVWQLDMETYGATRVATAIPDELIEAAQVGNAVLVIDYLWAGGDVDGRDSTGRTMLMFAAAAGRSAVVEVLLAAR